MPENKRDLALRGDEKSLTQKIDCQDPDKCVYRTGNNIMELEKCPTCPSNANATTEQTHLSTLILRVKNDEESLGYATKEHLINLVEYIVSWQRYTKQEYITAIEILAFYHLAQLASKNRIHARKFIAEELAKTYEARCKRCGLPISSKASLKTGHGIICRRKLGITANDKKEEAEVQ